MNKVNYEVGESITSNNKTFRIVKSITICPCIECYAYDHTIDLCIYCNMGVIPSGCCFKLVETKKMKTLKPGQLFTHDGHVYRVKRASDWLFVCQECGNIKINRSHCINICNNKAINFEIPRDCYIKFIK